MSKNKRQNEDNFQDGNLKDRQLKIRKSQPDASRFTEPDQNKQIKQRPMF